MSADLAHPATPPTPSHSVEAMLEALKRKLVTTATELQSTVDRLASKEGELEMEKREHQLTTTKLTTLLRKRSSAGSDTPNSNNSNTPRDEHATTDVGLLHQQIGMLQQQLRASQEKEAQMRTQLAASAEQYEKLRLLTLEGFRAQRAADHAAASQQQQSAPDLAEPDASTHSASSPTTTDEEQTQHAAATTTTPAASTAGAVPATPAALKQQPSAIVEAVRLALQPLPRPHAELSYSAQMWRRPAEHAQPRVGMPRSRSDMTGVASLGANQPLSRSASGVSAAARVAPLAGTTNQPLSRSASGVSASLSSLVTAAAHHTNPSPTVGPEGSEAAHSASVLASPGAVTASPVMQSRTSVPFGYKEGAICVEPPKRQRTVSTVLHSPRAGSGS